MSTSPAKAGWQFELNRPLSDSAQKLNASASSLRRHSGYGASVTVRDKQDPFRVNIQATPSRGGS
jgi:hypothetical protein